MGAFQQVALLQGESRCAPTLRLRFIAQFVAILAFMPVLWWLAHGGA